MTEEVFIKGAIDLVNMHYEKIARYARSKYGDLSKKYFEDFRSYYNATNSRVNKVKLICQPDKEVDLDSVYESSNFLNSNSNFSDKELFKLAYSSQNFIVSGNGGSGKSLFMRKLWVTLFAEDDKKIPVFLELRSLKNATKINLS